MGTGYECVLCDADCHLEVNTLDGVVSYECPSCGQFTTAFEAEVDHVDTLSQAERRRIAACVRERNLKGLPPLRICYDEQAQNPQAGAFTVEYILNNIFPSRIQDRFDRALANLCRMTPAPGIEANLKLHDVMPITFAETKETSKFMMNELVNMGYIVTPAPDANLAQRPVTVTAAGIARMQELEAPEGREASRQAFVAMWFDKELHELYTKGIVPAVEKCGYNPLRIDAKETNQKVCDEIIAEIRRSRFIVADVTGCRAGVYFEAGFAMGLGIPVIWTCKNDEEEIKALHFDTRQYAHVLWDSPEDLSKKLADRISATIIPVKSVSR